MWKTHTFGMKSVVSAKRSCSHSCERGRVEWPTRITLKRFCIGKRDTVSTKGSERGPEQMKTTDVTADGPASASASYY